jgi:hypothetical protein
LIGAADRRFDQFLAALKAAEMKEKKERSRDAKKP